MPINIGGMEFGSVDEVLEAQQKGLVPVTVQKHDTNDASPSIQVPHGLFHDQNTGGLFTRPGAEPDMYSTVVQPSGGAFIDELFVGTDVIWNPEYDVLTGVNGLQGSAAAGSCEPGPNPGTAKLATFRQPLGMFKIETNQGDITKAGSRINRSDLNRQLRNPIGMGGRFAPDILGAASNLNTTAGLALMRLGVSIRRQFGPVLWNGVAGTNGGAGSMWTEEFNGFDQQLVENPTDVRGLTIPAASSQIFAWGNTDVGGTVGGDDIVQLSSAAMNYIMTLGEDTNLPHGGVLAMHPDLFYNLTAVWPCSYITDRCAVDSSSGESLNASAEATTTMRNAMRSGKFLWINGMQVPVICTSDIVDTPVGGGVSSDIYYIPLVALGEKVTYIEGFDMSNADATQFANLLGPNSDYRAMNGGLYAVTKRQSDFCLEYVFLGRPRLVVRTPWMAFRITGVNYTMPGKAYTRDYDPDGGVYYRNGGQYWNSLPSYS